MPRDGSGGYSLPNSPVVSDTVIDETVYNSNNTDMANAHSAAIVEDGQNPFTGNQPMGTNKLTGLGAGSARTDSVNAGQVQDGTLNWADAGGTADALTAAYSPAITALVDGQVCYVRAADANATTTPSFSPNGLTARTIVKNDDDALTAGDITGNGHELILRYRASDTKWVWLNAAGAIASASATVAGIVELATTAETETGTDAGRAVTPDGLHDMTTLSGAAWFLDEDNMASNSAVKTASQQSIKAYADAIAAGANLAQMVSTTYATYSSHTNVIAQDDSIPQLSEGDQILSQAITPTNASSTLVIIVMVPMRSGSGVASTMALFKDSGADAVEAVDQVPGTGQNHMVPMIHIRSAGSTSAQTFTVRVGTASGSLYINGSSSARTMGGVKHATIMILEILP